MESKRPLVKKSESVVELFSPSGDHGFMTIAFEAPGLFKLENHNWDSVERFLMYQMYRGTVKGEEIKNAPSLAEARKIFHVNKLISAKTPRQLVVNQKLKPIVESKKNSRYNLKEYLWLANKEKIQQNPLLKTKLLSTGKKQIVNKNPYDQFGYESNLLGDSLMKIRAEYLGIPFTPSKTNNLTMQKYPHKLINKRPCYVIKGNPTPEMAAKLRGLCTVSDETDANHRLIRGKVEDLVDGSQGWVFPVERKEEARDLIFETFPESKRVQIYGKKWVKKQLASILEIAILFSTFQDHKETTASDVMFAVKDAFNYQELLLEQSGEPTEKFVESIQKYAKKYNTVISDEGVDLFWKILTGLVKRYTEGVKTFAALQEMLTTIDNGILEKKIEPFQDLTERETLIISTFNRLYKLFKEIKPDCPEGKIAVITVCTMVGKENYEAIKGSYSKKVALKNNGGRFLDEEQEFRRLYSIKTPHLKTILTVLPNVNKKCRLFILTSLTFVMNLENENAINTCKRLIMLDRPEEKHITPVAQKLDFVEDLPKIEPVLKDDAAFLELEASFNSPCESVFSIADQNL